MGKTVFPNKMIPMPLQRHKCTTVRTFSPTTPVSTCRLQMGWNILPSLLCLYAAHQGEWLRSEPRHLKLLSCLPEHRFHLKMFQSHPSKPRSRHYTAQILLKSNCAELPPDDHFKLIGSQEVWVSPASQPKCLFNSCPHMWFPCMGQLLMSWNIESWAGERLLQAIAVPHGSDPFHQRHPASLMLIGVKLPGRDTEATFKLTLSHLETSQFFFEFLKSSTFTLYLF